MQVKILTKQLKMQLKVDRFGVSWVKMKVNIGKSEITILRKKPKLDRTSLRWFKLKVKVVK